MKKEYVKPDVETIDFLIEELLMAGDIPDGSREISGEDETFPF